MDYGVWPRDGDIVVALVDSCENTVKVYSRQCDKITLTPDRNEAASFLHFSCKPDFDPRHAD